MRALSPLCPAIAPHQRHGVPRQLTTELAKEAGNWKDTKDTWIVLECKRKRRGTSAADFAPR